MTMCNSTEEVYSAAFNNKENYIELLNMKAI